MAIDPIGCPDDVRGQCFWKKGADEWEKDLSVDDSASVRQMVAFTLRSAGYEVIEACDGRDALGQIKSASVDMVITDSICRSWTGWS